MIDLKVDNFPIHFEKISEYSVNDARFVKVKIWMMHLGENPNGSFFSKEDVERNLPSLSNTPILGFVEDNKSGEEDFSNHRSILEKKNGKFVFKYAGSAYGVIPESHNAKWEWKMCDDGKEREFLTCEGLVWTKWDEPVDILNRDFTKAQSMELHPDYRGYYDNKTKLFHFTDFKFFGACVLGSDYKPGMVNASIEMQSFSDSFEQIMDQFKDEVSRMTTAFEQFEAQRQDQNSSDANEGGTTVEEKLQLLAKFNFTREAVEAKGIDFEAISMDELEGKLTEFAAEAAPAADTPADDTSSDDTNKEFALTANQKVQELSSAIKVNPVTDEWGWTEYDYYYVDHTDTHIVAYRRADFRLVGIEYTMDGDKPVVNFDTTKRFKVEYAPMEGNFEENDEFNLVATEYADHKTNVAVKKAEAEFTATNEEAMNALKSEFESLKASNETLTQEVTELREFKSNYIATARKDAEDALFAEFGEQLSDEEMKPVRDKANEYELDELRIHLFALVGMKNHKPAQGNFSAGKADGSVRIGIDGDVTPKKSSKPYAHLIEQVRASKS